MSLLRYKQKLLPYGNAMGGDGGGGGGGGATTSTSYNTNIPEYAKPYVEGMLEATQKQIYNDDRTSFRPYTPYSTDVNNYFAGFSDLQKQAQYESANMQQPGQFNLGSGLAGMAGMGSLGAAQGAQPLMGQAGMYGGMGAGYGAQAAGMAPTAQAFGQESADIGMGGLGYGALGTGYGAQAAGMSGMGFGAGQQYAQNVTSPQSMQAYMSPYQQSVTDVAKTAAVREAQMAQQAQNLGAARQGTYGGARQTLAQAEREKNLLSNLSNIQAQGSQSAYDRALQSQQFGANLGLQGLGAGYQGLGMGMQGAQTGLQGLGTALQGQQARMAGLGQAGQFLGQGMQGAQTGLQGVQGAVGAGQYGLAGYGQAGQAASTLGQLGTQQQAADIARQNQMSLMGKQQQDLEQQKINQAIQTYAIQQQYPQMQLGFMSNMLRGLPLQAQTTQLYQAQPSIMQQGVGLLGAGASLFGRKEGGAIKEYREGGVASVPGYKYGKLISEPKLESMADDLTIPQLQQRLKDPALTPGERQVFAEALQEKMQQEKSRMSGIAMAGGPAFESQGMAGGGILAFAGEDDSLVEEDKNKVMSFEERLQRAAAAPKKPFQYDSLASKLGQLPSKLSQFQPTKKQEESPIFTGNTEFDLKRQAEMEEQDTQKELGIDKILAKKETGRQDAAAKEGTSGKAGPAAATSKDFKSFLAEMKEVGPKGQVGEEFEKFLGEQMGDPNRLSRKERLAMAKGFLKFASTPAPGGIGQAAAAGLGEYVTGVEAARDAEDKIKSETAKARMELDKARRAEQRGDVTGAREAYDKYEDRMTRIQAAQIGAGAAGAPQRYTEQQIRNVMAENPGMSYSDALTRVAGAGRMENVEVQRAKAALASIDARLGLMGKKDPRYADLEAQRTEIIKFLTPGGGIGGGQTTQTAGTVPKDIQGILNRYQ